MEAGLVYPSQSHPPAPLGPSPTGSCATTRAQAPAEGEHGAFGVGPRLFCEPDSPENMPRITRETISQTAHLQAPCLSAGPDKSGERLAADLNLQNLAQARLSEDKNFSENRSTQRCGARIKPTPATTVALPKD